MKGFTQLCRKDRFVNLALFQIPGDEDLFSLAYDNKKSGTDIERNDWHGGCHGSDRGKHVTMVTTTRRRRRSSSNN